MSGKFIVLQRIGTDNIVGTDDGHVGIVSDVIMKDLGLTEDPTMGLQNVPYYMPEQYRLPILPTSRYPYGKLEESPEEVVTLDYEEVDFRGKTYTYGGDSFRITAAYAPIRRMWIIRRPRRPRL